MKNARTVVVTDPLARANVMAVLAGPGAPSGVGAISAQGDAIVVEYDADRTSTELVDALIEIAARFVPVGGGALDDRTAAALAARGLDEPALDASRIIETHLL